jgi:hypothetical protein
MNTRKPASFLEEARDIPIVPDDSCTGWGFTCALERPCKAHQHIAKALFAAYEEGLRDGGRRRVPSADRPAQTLVPPIEGR